jgi:F-type H+-transporting ATPase subunit b
MKQLGIEPSLLLAQIINFSIIAFVLSKLLYKPILAMLEKRKKEIEAGLAITQKMREEEEKLKVKQDKLLDQTRKEAKEIVEKAKKDAVEAEKKIIAEAHAEAGMIIAKAKTEIESLKTQMMKSVEKSSIELAVEMTKRLTSAVLSDLDQHKLITRQLKDLKL